MVRTVTTAPTASRADIDSLVNKYNLMHEISQAAKRDMTKFKTEVNDLRAEVQSYRSLTDLALEGHRNDLLNELHADFNKLLQGISDEESTRDLLVQEVRDLNLEIRHTYRLIRESLLRINGLENFTGVGKLK
jgi:phage shock protein A